MYRSILILSMYTLRTIETDGRETNLYLGEHYTLSKIGNVDWNVFNRKLDVFFGNADESNLKERNYVAAFIDAENLPNSLPLYYTKQHYVVTLGGKTFQKLNFVLPETRFSDTYESEKISCEIDEKLGELKFTKDQILKSTQNDTKSKGDKEMSIKELAISGIIPNVEMIKTSSIEYDGKILWVSEWNMELEDLLEKHKDHKIWILDSRPGSVRAIVHKPSFVKSR
jgi:hypothetical protein